MANKKIVLLIVVIITLILAVTIIPGCIPHTNATTTPNSTSTTTIGPNGEIDPPDRDPIDYTSTMLLVDALFKNFSIFDVDAETAMLAAIKAYVQATGDKYALFYTPEELAAMESENNGDLYGIGVQVIFDYDEYFMEVVLIMPDSPAEECLQIGDRVTHIVVDGETISLADVVQDNKDKIKELYPQYTEEENNNAACYEAFQYAVANLKGPEGTFAEFTRVRDGEAEVIKVQRAKVKTLSVTCKTSIRDPKVGIVSIMQFDLTTPVQFKACMDQLISQGCDKFVFDLRNNPGGDLASVTAVLSTLLEKDDVIISTKDYQNKTQVTKVGVVNYGTSSNYSTCNVTESDIGKYRGYEMVVLANENSASAAELFTAALRDHKLAQTVGVKTYGKGSVQSIISLENYGTEYYGALKLTTKLYFPPSGVGYDGGIGITPDHPVELEGIAAETHFYKLTEEIDNQLQKAVSVLID